MSSYNVMVDNGDLDGCVVDVVEVLDILRGIYGDLDDDRGAYCNRNWLSVRDIVKVIVDNAYPND